MATEHYTNTPKEYILSFGEFLLGAAVVKSMPLARPKVKDMKFNFELYLLFLFLFLSKINTNSLQTGNWRQSIQATDSSSG